MNLRTTLGRVTLFVIVSVILILVQISEAFAADTFPGPALGVGGSFVDNNIGTTGEVGEPTTLPAGTTLNTQWYSWTAPVSGFVSFGTCNPTGSNLTNFDTTIGIYTGSAVNALTQIGFNDDTPGCNSVVNANYGSTVAFTAVAGTTYRIQVDGYNTTTGQFNLFYGYSGYTTAVTGATATEGGGTGAFTVVLNAVPTGTATITIGTSPQCTFAPNPLTFTSANWNVAQTVTVTAINDTIVEGGHFCAPSSITPSGGGVVGSAAPPPTISVTDNDTATVTIANTTNGVEAGSVSGVMTITQSAVSATNTAIAYTVTGTATSGADYTVLSGTVTIPAGQTTATITIPINDDAIVEGAETVIVTMNSLTGSPGVALGVAATRTATNTITDNDTATVTLANTTQGNEAGPVSGVMTLTQTAASGVNTVIAYSVAGTATNGTDYTALSGTVTIPAGSTTANITIPVIDDVVVEGNETVVITLTSITSGSPGVTLGAAPNITATNTIADNDAPTVTIANTTNGNEAGPVNGVMTVTMTAVRPTAVTLSYSVAGTATSGVDFTALSGTVTIAAGATTATISIPVIDDLIVEGNETVVVTLTAVTSGAASLGAAANLVASNTITDNDTATVTIANTTNGNEAGAVAGVMTVTQTKVSATNTVIAYTVSGTATSGADYTALSGTVTIPAGSTTATIDIPVNDDAIVEGGETVIVTLTSITSGLPTLGATLIATNTITDNDAATVTIANTTDGAEAGPVNGVMTVTQTAVSATNTVIAYTVSGTATSGSDYTALSGTVTIPAGATTATITIPVTNDAIVENAETVIVTLTAISSGLPTLGATLTATNTIADNDSATVTIANTTDGAEAGPVNGVMTVTQTAVSATNTVVAYTVSGTATSGSDFTALSGTVTIPAGSTTATISIPVINDAIVEGSETVVITLTSVSSGLATLGATLTATNTIADNDSATVTVANGTNGTEVGPSNGTMTLTQTAVSATNTVIAYTVTGTATSGADYTALSGSVTILAGATTATITIPVIDDAIAEGSETVVVTLTSVSSGLATLGATLTATNTIADNDSATVTIANTTNGVEAGPVNGVMTVTQTAVSATNTVIAYSVSGTATSGSDYTTLSGTVTIPAGVTTATITIPVINDLVVDPSETVIVTLTAISSGLATLGVTLGATNTITDNDVASLTVSKAVNQSNISSPQTLTYTITVANTGNIPLTGPVITDTLSNGVTLTLTSGPTLTSGDAAPLGTINVGETWIYTATYAVTQSNINGGATIANSATFKTNETILQTTPTVSTTITRTPQLTTLKTASTAGPVPVGTVITYKYKVTNSGNVTMAGVSVGDTHNGSGTFVGPNTETIFTDVAPSGDSTDLFTNGSWDTLGPGDTLEFTATYTVTQQDVDLLQ
jgi:Calx-beta domain/Domain of unknown function DUF11